MHTKRIQECTMDMFEERSASRVRESVGGERLRNLKARC